MSSIRTISNYAFKNFKLLETVRLSNQVENIGEEAFAGCTFLFDFYLPMEKPTDFTYGADLFMGIDLSSSTLHVPAGCAKYYSRADQWKEFGNIIDDWSGVEDVIVDGDAEGFDPSLPIEYYDLNGNRVVGASLTPAVYIVRQGAKTAKILVK